jgi:two-component system chemotaxis response regulator CheB
MQRIRILVVDDSAVARRILCEALAADPSLEVVGTAPNGRIALAKLATVSPDVVLLDVDMPEMDGLETLAAIRACRAALPVIMCSALTERGAAATLEALARSASDYWAKPSAGGLDGARQRIRDELVPKIKVWGARHAGGEEPAGAAARESLGGPRPGRATTEVRVDVVAIGVSTGGPNALATLLPALPPGFPVPVLIVQHMPPVFTRLFAERLAARAAIEVREGRSGEPLLGASAWLAPGNHHMVLDARGGAVRLATHQDPPVNFCRPAVDVLFHSVAAVFGRHALGVVLTGMGSDGVAGCRRIRAAGGAVLVQDQATSVVWGMPGLVARAGLADRVLPLGEIGAEILRRVGVGRPALAGRSAAGGRGR